MGTGYDFTVARRLSSPYGLTEWEFSSHVSEMQERITALSKLNHRWLYGFLLYPHIQVFYIRQQAPRWVFNRMIDLMSAWPDEVKEQLRVIEGTPPFPSEVIAWIWWHFQPREMAVKGKGPRVWNPDDPWQPDPARISAYPKNERSRNASWELTLSYGASAGIDQSAWRKCHTEKFWAWFVPDGVSK